MKQFILPLVCTVALLIGCGKNTTAAPDILTGGSQSSSSQAGSSQVSQTSNTNTPSSQTTQQSGTSATTQPGQSSAAINPGLSNAELSSTTQSSSAISSSSLTFTQHSSAYQPWITDSADTKIISDGKEHYDYKTGDTKDSSFTVNPNTQLIETATYYDESGNLAQLDIYDSTGTYAEKIQEYTNNTISKLIGRSSPTQLEFIQEYDLLGTKKSLTNYVNNIIESKQDYDTMGNPIILTNYTPEGLLQSIQNYVDGVLNQRHDYSTDGITKTLFSEYNTTGIMARQTSYFSDGIATEYITEFILSTNAKGYRRNKQFLYNIDGTIAAESLFGETELMTSQIQYNYAKETKTTITFGPDGIEKTNILEEDFVQ